ncbi:MAG: hypothetical protein HRU20_28380 [Pseudomonadales bacterium]|nr:hypothetical protein [Pseudomonadales bacterium]
MSKQALFNKDNPIQSDLFLNALSNACNREPVMVLDECLVQEVSDGLIAKSCVSNMPGQLYSFTI